MLSWERSEERKAKGLVPCDDAKCPAKEEPVTPDELMAAVEHWRDHNYLSGCSHSA